MSLHDCCACWSWIEARRVSWQSHAVGHNLVHLHGVHAKAPCYCSNLSSERISFALAKQILLAPHIITQTMRNLDGSDAIFPSNWLKHKSAFALLPAACSAHASCWGQFHFQFVKFCSLSKVARKQQLPEHCYAGSQAGFQEWCDLSFMLYFTLRLLLPASIIIMPSRWLAIRRTSCLLVKYA